MKMAKTNENNEEIRKNTSGALQRRFTRLARMNEPCFWKRVFCTGFKRPVLVAECAPLTVGICLIGLSGAGREAWAAQMGKTFCWPAQDLHID